MVVKTWIDRFVWRGKGGRWGRRYVMLYSPSLQQSPRSITINEQTFYKEWFGPNLKGKKRGASYPVPVLLRQKVWTIPATNLFVYFMVV